MYSAQAVRRLSDFYGRNLLPRPNNPETWAALRRSGIKLKELKSAPGCYEARLPKGWRPQMEGGGWFTLRNPQGQPRFHYLWLLDEQGAVVEAYTEVARRYGICHDDTPSPTSYLDPATGQHRNDLLNYYLYDYEARRRVPFGPFAEELGHTVEECRAAVLERFPDPNPDAYWTEPPRQLAWWQPRRWLR